LSISQERFLLLNICRTDKAYLAVSISNRSARPVVVRYSRSGCPFQFPVFVSYLAIKTSILRPGSFQSLKTETFRDQISPIQESIIGSNQTGALRARILF
jgi:hypothetical protein